MGSIDNIVNVQITRTTRTVSRAGFGTGLILGPNATALGTYNSIDDVAADFSANQAEYKAALSYFGQEIQPTALYIGKRTPAVAQVDTWTPVAVDNTVYSLSIDGVTYSYTSGTGATAASIVTGLKAAISSDASCLANATGTSTLILTAKTAGSGFDAEQVGPGVLTVAHTTASNGIVEDIEAASQVDNDWYMLFLCSRSESDILAAARYIETQSKYMLVCTNEAGVIASTTSDTAAMLSGLGYDRTGYLYSSDQANFPELSWAGGVLPLDPGSETWKFKSLTGNVADNLTPSQLNNAQAKNANVYYPVGGVNITAEGVSASGEYIDVIRFIDFLHARVTEDVFELLVSNSKIPFTDTGISMVQSVVMAVMIEGERVGGLVPGSSYVTVPKAADISTADKAARFLEGMEFGGDLAGAIHKTKIVGKISI